MKAYRSVDDPDSIQLFRPDKNMEVRQNAFLDVGQENILSIGM